MGHPGSASCEGAEVPPGSCKTEAWAAGTPAAHAEPWEMGRQRGCAVVWGMGTFARSKTTTAYDEGRRNEEARSGAVEDEDGVRVVGQIPGVYPEPLAGMGMASEADEAVEGWSRHGAEGTCPARWPAA